MFKELKKISKHYAVYAMGSAIDKSIGFIMIPVYTRFVTPAEYGILGILNFIVWMASLVIGMNLSAGVSRFYFAYNDIKERNAVISTSLIFSILLSIPILLCLIYFSDRLAIGIFHNASFSGYFKITFIALLFEILLYIPFVSMRIANKSLKFITYTLIRLVIGLCLNIILIVFLKLGIYGILYSQLVTAVIISMMLVIATFKEYGFAFNISPLKKILKYSFPLIPASLAMLILNLGDRYILPQFVPLEDVGLYTLGYKITMMLGFIIGGPFRFVWQPYRFSIANDENASFVYSRIFTYFTFFISFVALAIAVFSKDIIKLISTPPYYDAYKVIPIVTLGYVFYQLYYMLNFGIMLKNRTGLIAYIVSASALLNIILNFWLIPKFGIMAAAYITFVSFLFLTMLAHIISQRLYRIPYEYTRLYKILVSCLGLYFASFFIGSGIKIIGFLYKFLVVISFPFLLYLIRFYTYQELDKIKELVKGLGYRFKLSSLRILNLLAERE